MTIQKPIQLAFLLSGVAGLVHEVLWSRYLGLFVGHGAYAQVLVLAVYLGGMAVGSLAVSDLSRRLRDPLQWYLRAEVVLAIFGFAFHGLYLLGTGVSHDVVFPLVGSASLVGATRWAVAGALILPQAIVLGATFPLMAAGLVRDDVEHPGGAVARAYLLNTLGGAGGVLLAGFVFIGAFGLAGTSVAAGALNLLAAALVGVGLRSRGHSGSAAGASGARASDAEVDGRLGEPAESGSDPSRVLPGGSPVPSRPSWAPEQSVLVPLVLSVAFGTAFASFAYEIGWIRMLSLLLGGATHSFELMLSAFILGIAGGALLIQRRSDTTADPVRLLGGIQVAMGLAALLSLPVYLASFEAVAGMIRTFSGQPNGYTAFNLGRYGLALAVMLPSTLLAGMTLPVMTGALLRAGAGERTIGLVYGVNTIGSVAGAGIAGLVALPLLGLKGLIVAGAAVDVVLGLVLLERSGSWSGRGRRALGLAAAAGAFLFAVVPAAVTFEPTTVASGVFRLGRLEGETWHSLYYQDGRTATVSAHVIMTDGLVVLSTNGKPDASLGPRWFFEGRDTIPEVPIPQGRDFTTQVLAPIVALAHRPDARSVANIGHGSGMTAASLLTSPEIERLVTIEIEPLMVEGSLVFMPVNRSAFEDPRVSYVFDDAKSFFSYGQERFDIVFAEPSNPWVSGTASLFTVEFYRRIVDVLEEDGVLAQWMQLYELDDDLFLSVLAALDEVFPSYRAYMVGDADVALIASRSTELGEPDWQVIEREAFRRLTAGAPPFRPQHMESLFLFDQRTFRSLLDARERATGIVANSDFRPVLDLGAEKARFENTAATGTYSLAVSRVNLGRHVSGLPFTAYDPAMPPSYGMAATVATERGAWLREAVRAGGGIAPEEFPDWQRELVHLQSFFPGGGDGAAPEAWDALRWQAWAAGFVRAENALHWGTSDWTDSTFYGHVYGTLRRGDPPAEARAAVELLNAYALGDWPRAAEAAETLVEPVAAGERWAPAELVLDIAVLAHLEAGRPDRAAAALEALVPATGRSPRHLRTRLLRALVDEALPGA